MKKVLFGLPSLDGKFNTKVLHNITQEFPYLIGEHYYIEFALVNNTLIHQARNIIAKRAVEEEYDYLFFVDNDIELAPNALEKLLIMDKDVASGVYFVKRTPHFPVIYRDNGEGAYYYYWNFPKDKIIETEGVGMGCCLIKVDVLKQLGENPFDPYPPINGEDLAFCKRVYENDFTIWTDTSILCGHITNYTVTERDFRLGIDSLDEKTMDKLNALEEKYQKLQKEK